MHRLLQYAEAHAPAISVARAELGRGRAELEAGETSPLPVRLAEAELAEARQEQLQAEQGYRMAVLELAAASGWSEPRLPEPTGQLDRPRHAPEVRRLARLARAQNPVVAAQAARVKRARAALAAARRSGWPNPSLGVRYARESEPGSGLDADIFTGTLSVPIPLWRGSAPQTARARAELEAALAARAAYERTLEHRVRRAAQALDASAERVHIYREQIVPHLEKNLGLLERAFEFGEIDVTEVLVARERFLRAQRNALDAYDEYYRALGEIEAQVGTELWPDTDHGPRGGR